jgi:hypothetical protein
MPDRKHLALRGEAGKRKTPADCQNTDDGRPFTDQTQRIRIEDAKML